MDHKKMNVLIVSGGGYQGLTLTKSLRDSDLIRIIMVDSSEENINKYFVDRFYVVPSVKRKKQFLNSIFEVCEKEKVRIIFPSTEIEILPLAESLERFKEKNILVAVPNRDFLKRISNKRLLYHLLLMQGFPTLPTLDITKKAIPYPVLGKPVRGWGSKGMIVLNSPDHIHQYQISELKKNYVWQPYLKDFEEYSIDCAINFDEEISDFVIRKRIKVIGGFAAICENLSDDRINQMIKHFLNVIQSIGARGIFNIQILKKGQDYFFSDVNPRMGTSAIYSCKLGVNLPLFLCSSIDPRISKKKARIPSEQKKIKMVRYLEELWIEPINASFFKGIVFDLDDTLINQKLWMFEKLKILHKKFRKSLPGKSEFLTHAIQIIEEGNRSKLFDALSRELNIKEELKDKLITCYRTIQPSVCPVFPEVIPTLDRLKEMGFKLALLTDNPIKSQKQKIKTSKLDERFDRIVYSRVLNCEKPNRNVFVQVSKLLKIRPPFLMMVGDNLYRDVLGALKAGYGFAYWITREGTFFNFERKIYEELFKNHHFVKIHNLQHILFSLRKSEKG